MFKIESLKMLLKLHLADLQRLLNLFDLAYQGINSGLLLLIHIFQLGFVHIHVQ